MVTPEPGWQWDPDLNKTFLEQGLGTEPVPDPGYESFQGGRPS